MKELNSRLKRIFIKEEELLLKVVLTFSSASSLAKLQGDIEQSKNQHQNHILFHSFIVFGVILIGLIFN